MFGKIRLGRRPLLIGLPVALILLLGLSIVSGFATDVEQGLQGATLDHARFDDGLVSLEEMVLLADVIAVVELEGVSRGVVRWKRGGVDLGYGKTLEYQFGVEQYLKGAGGDEVTGIVVSREFPYKTAAGAALMGEDPDKNRKTNWDDRRAVVFLIGDGKDPDLNWKQDRYRLGASDERDLYSVANHVYRAWLPAVAGGGDTQTFLLESDLNNSNPATITLDDLKQQIELLNAATAGQTERYMDCVFEQYSWHRKVSHWGSGGEYWYSRSDVEIASGLPADSHIFTGPIAGYVVQSRAEQPLGPGEFDLYVLAGRDAGLFTGTPPGFIAVARPLPEGEYKTYHAFLSYGMGAGCGGSVPNIEMQRQELFVAVTAPEGTVQEAFFDPVADGDNLTGATRGSPIGRIMWKPTRSDGGTLTAASTTDLAKHRLDFIALDGTTSLSLDASDATATSGAVTWQLKEPPFAAGDELMLRVVAE